jgi:magnesium transporter
MITIRRSTGTDLETIEKPTTGCWIEVTNPSPDEAASLARDLNFPQEFVSFSLDPDEIPIIEKADSAFLILARIPHFQGQSATVPYATVPIGLIVTGEHVVTLCRYEHELLRGLPHEHQADLSTAKPTRFVLHLLWSAANSYLGHLNEINKVVEKLEEGVERSLQNREVLALLRYQKSLLHFTTALRANETMFERLKRCEFLKLGPNDEDLLDDVFTETHQAIGMSEIASDILSQMMDAFATIISNNLNVVMKFLTAMAVILIVPTIIATFYGMNVRLPLEDSPSGFLVVVGLSILSSFVVGFIFRKKNWL